MDETDELAALRRRAYAPDGDIANDPAALRRLIALEERASASQENPAPVADSPPAPVVDSPPADEESPDATAEKPRYTLPRLRRSTVILLGAAVLVAATLVTLLVVVQRVQTDPLQTGAEQVARLSPDPGFEVPSTLTQGTTGEITAYEEFEGFRAISQPAYRDETGDHRCMTVWQPALLEASDGGGFSYGGEFFLLSVCAAGVFPAASTMLLGENTPERAQTDLPAGTALQFVYDSANDEIVVFRG